MFCESRSSEISTVIDDSLYQHQDENEKLECETESLSESDAETESQIKTYVVRNVSSDLRMLKFSMNVLEETKKDIMAELNKRLDRLR